MLVQVIDVIPERLFEIAKIDAFKIKWNDRARDYRSNFDVFYDSPTLHLRIHQVPDGPKPTTIEEWCKHTECIDNPKFINKFIKTKKLVDWIYERVDGISLGRVMIINLEPRGKVNLHVDPLDYFAKYSRYHVPLKTNPGVIFSGEPGTPHEHMPLGHLCRLNNRLPHRLDNNSDENRIHLLVDIETADGNQIF